MTYWIYFVFGCGIKLPELVAPVSLELNLVTFVKSVAFKHTLVFKINYKSQMKHQEYKKNISFGFLFAI